MKRILTGVACFFILIQLTQAQSVYSFQGLGSLNHQGMPNNVGMGEVGIGAPTIWHINTQNPANLVYNTFSTFQLGMEVDRRRFSGQDISGTDSDGGLRFLGFAFPIIPGKWSSSLSLLPFSSVSYNTFSEGDITNTEGDFGQVSNNRGEGGLTNLSWGNGFNIGKVQAGVKITYSFGSIEKGSNIFIFERRELIDDQGDTTIVNIPLGNPSDFTQLQSYSDFNFQFGLGYRHKLSEERFLNFGFIFSPKSSLNGTSELSLARLSDSGNPQDTVNLGSEPIRFDLPTSLGYGMSYEKLNHYKIGFDIETHLWSDAGNDNQELNNSVKFAFGGSWVPDFDNVNSLWKRAKYSAGFNYHKLPYIVNNQALIDFGINFGASLPVNGFSSLDLAFKWGQLGETTNGLIKETYYKVVIGATINDRWFIKRKYD